ncbi:M50 family metallopeptidase [Georgenia halophila]|uniref:M50 family metallopeptidase n=1 Tax=Georgenia halophila TaxID=620889 RepID=A0ABP8LDA3_9MICO
MEDFIDGAATWFGQAWVKLQPGSVPRPDDAVLAVVAFAVLVAVVVPTLWRALRVGVTVVHELGHGLVGVLLGRRFTGLVLRADMSGHAVTVGPARGAGRVLSTWAGYPAPAVLGALLVRAAGTGWSGPVLGAAAAVLIVSLIRVRSLYSAVVMLVVTTGTSALWWWGSADLQAAALLGIGLFLLVGAWRHLAALVTGPSAGSDAGALARLTRVPAWLWVLSFAVVLVAATWNAVGPARAALGM